MYVRNVVSFIPECARSWRRKKNMGRVADTHKKKIERKKVIEGKEIGERMKIKVLWDTTPC